MVNDETEAWTVEIGVPDDGEYDTDEEALGADHAELDESGDTVEWCSIPEWSESRPVHLAEICGKIAGTFVWCVIALAVVSGILAIIN